MHLRDAHNVSTITPETVAKIRNIIFNGTASDAARVVDQIFEKYNCNGEPECSWRYIEEAEMILKKAHRCMRVSFGQPEPVQFRGGNIIR